MKTKKMYEERSRTILTSVSIGLVVLLMFGVASPLVIADNNSEDDVGVSSGVMNGNVKEMPNDDVRAVEPIRRDSGEISFELNPRRRVAEDRSATYEITLVDLHEEGNYNYELEFEARDEMTGEFSDPEILLSAGEKAEIKLVVSTTDKALGPHPFVVKLSGEGVEMAIRGILLVGGDILPKEPVRDVAFFHGAGFILSEDEFEGHVTELQILKKNSNLLGKMKVGKRNLRIEGSVNDRDVEWKVFPINSNEQVGSFKGEVIKYNSFLLLKGDLNSYGGETWKLTAMAKRKGVIRAVGISESEEVSVEEVISVGSSDDSNIENEVYFRPVEIRKRRFLGVLPNPWGKKVVEVEVIKGEEVSTEVIAENSAGSVQGYEVNVGSLDDEEAIEITVEEA